MLLLTVLRLNKDTEIFFLKTPRHTYIHELPG